LVSAAASLSVAICPGDHAFISGLPSPFGSSVFLPRLAAGGPTGVVPIKQLSDEFRQPVAIGALWFGEHGARGASLARIVRRYWAAEYLVPRRSTYMLSTAIGVVCSWSASPLNGVM
jgi:hypothetical protein